MTNLTIEEFISKLNEIQFQRFKQENELLRKEKEFLEQLLNGTEYINHTRNRSVKLPPSGQDSMSLVPSALTDLTTPPNSLQVRAPSITKERKEDA